MPPSRGRRSAVRSGGTALVSQAKAPYIHQIAASIRTTCASASPFGWWTKHRRQLRDREDEDEVEEELERTRRGARRRSTSGRRVSIACRSWGHARPQVGYLDRRVLSALASNFNDLMAETLFDNGKGSGAAEAGRQLACFASSPTATRWPAPSSSASASAARSETVRTSCGSCWRTRRAPSRRSPGRASPSASRSAPPARSSWSHGSFAIHPQFGKQIKLAAVRPAGPGEYDAEQLAEGPARSVELLETDLRELIETVQNRSLHELLDRFFGPETESWARFREAPAAKHYHQAYAGGLLEHTLSVAQAVSAAANFFPGIDREIAVTGAMLHDIGKTEAYNDDPLAIELDRRRPARGRDSARLLQGAPRDRDGSTASTPTSPRRSSTSSSPTTGSSSTAPRSCPATREATLVHAIDNLGGKLGSFDRLEKELADGESWSRFDRGIDGSAFFGSRAA